MSYVEPLMRRNFLEYASYVIVDRAIPDLRDGCKPVQRRILWTLSEIDDGRFHKVANVIGETMKLHPHGDASIGDALVVLANKEYFIERQGNFGSILTGHPAAAARYIECRLTQLARDTLFHPKLTELRDSYDGRRSEPVFLPVKLPVLLLSGTEGIAVGMSTRILPHNFGELLEAQISLLRGEDVSLYPDFQQGGIMDVDEYDDGRGKVRVRARLETSRDRKTITIREIPYSTTTESLIASIEAATQKGRLKVGSIEDRTAAEVEIVLHLPRGVYADEVEPQLYAYTQCSVAITSSIISILDGRPVELGVTEILRTLTGRLKEQIRAELELELQELEDRQHALTLEQIFIENRVYKAIETQRTAEKVREAVWQGMEAYRMFFLREMVEEDVDRLLKIPIRRISIYDIQKSRDEVEALGERIAICRRKLKRLKATTIRWLEGLLETYGPRYPRRTEIADFEKISKKEVARQNLRVAWDPETGFLGTEVKGGDLQLSVSEFDKILVVSGDGTYRIVAPPEKLLVGRKVHAIRVFDEAEGVILTFVYRDPQRFAWAKKVQVTSYITDREYDLVKGREGTIDRLWVGEPEDLVARLKFVPAPRQRKTEDEYALAGLKVSGLGARGFKMAGKPVSRIGYRKKKDV